MFDYFSILLYIKTMGNIENVFLDEYQKKLVEDNVNLVYYLANKRGIKDENLIQEGMLALCNAARRYSKDFGVKFSTFASSHIWGSMFGSYSYKKNRKKSEFTCYLEDKGSYIEPYCEIGGCVELSSNVHPLANDIVKYVCEGFTKKDISELLKIDTSKLNSILKNVGEDLYGKRNR